MTQIGPCLLIAAILLTSCSREWSTKPQGGPDPSNSSSARSSTTNQTSGQELAYMSNVSAQVESSSGQGLSGEEVTVGMTNELRYVPEEVTIMVGQTVVWTNTSTLVHTVTADPLLAQRRRDVVLPEGAPPFSSGQIAPGRPSAARSTCRACTCTSASRMSWRA